MTTFDEAFAEASKLDYKYKGYILAAMKLIRDNVCLDAPGPWWQLRFLFTVKPEWYSAIERPTIAVRRCVNDAGGDYRVFMIAIDPETSRVCISFSEDCKDYYGEDKIAEDADTCGEPDAEVIKRLCRWVQAGNVLIDGELWSMTRLSLDFSGKGQEPQG